MNSWLEEIQRKQAEMIAARVSAEKLRFRDDALTAENESLKVVWENWVWCEAEVGADGWRRMDGPLTAQWICGG